MEPSIGRTKAKGSLLRDWFLRHVVLSSRTINFNPNYCVFQGKYCTQAKETMNTENTPGMCVLTNHTRDLVTAENEWILSHGIELVLESFRKTSRFNLHLCLTEIENAIPFYLRATRTTQAKIGLSAFRGE